MPFFALALALAAAALHAGWNFLAKSSRDTVAFMWWGVCIGGAGYSAVLVATHEIHFPSGVAVLYGVSIAAELGYFLTLVRGYRHGDLSQVYPLSRGSAPVFIALWSALFVGERLPAMGYAGLALMVAGVGVASRPARPDRDKPAPKGNAVGWALASGVFISVYSLCDKLLVGKIPPVEYNAWVYVGNAMTWFPFVWTRGRAGAVTAELRRNVWRVLAGAAMSVGAYACVLVALSLTHASYVVAARGTSVVIGAALGWLVLREGPGRLRVLGSVLMAAGLVMLALA